MSTFESSPATTTADEQGQEQEPIVRSAEVEGKSFDKLTAKGVEGGLFQACMKSIRSAHVRSNRVRAVLVLGGLFTDIAIYREVVACFYVLTKELETKLLHMAKAGGENSREDEQPICQKLLALGYRFTQPYEEDMAFLYGEEEWKEQVEAAIQSNAAVVSYREKIRQMQTEAELAGAVFVLWGGLIIGGGAAAMPRVKSLYGSEATHLFAQVTGPGRDERKRTFVETWDSLVEPNQVEVFDEIVRSSHECMQGNNDVLTSITRNPWWVSYVAYAGIAVLSVLAMLVLQRCKTS